MPPLLTHDAHRHLHSAFPTFVPNGWVRADVAPEARRDAARAHRRRRERQGLTLVHFLAQLERVLWDKGLRGGIV